MIVDVIQGSPEWNKLREKRMTASHGQAIGANAKGLITYIREKMCALYSTGEKISYTNANMEYGIEQESVAVMLYEFETDNKVQKIGFFILNDYIGCSPDGLIGKEGLIEIKCPTDKVYFNLLLDEKIDSGYVWQMQMQLYVTGRMWCDYVVYNPNFDQQLFITRIVRNEEMINKIKAGIESGKILIEEINYKIKGE